MENDIPVLTSAELEAVDLPEGAVVEGTDMPKPADYLSAKQKNGVPLGADEIYKETWLWLKERGCERLVNPRLLKCMLRHLQDTFSVRRQRAPTVCLESTRPRAE